MLPRKKDRDDCKKAAWRGKEGRPLTSPLLFELLIRLFFFLFSASAYFSRLLFYGRCDGAPPIYSQSSGSEAAFSNLGFWMGWVVEKMHRTMKRTAAAPPIFIPKWFLSSLESGGGGGGPALNVHSRKSFRERHGIYRKNIIIQYSRRVD